MLTDTWRSLIFTQFHDAITATHIDEANRDLMGIYGWIDADAAALTARAACTITERQASTGDDRPVTVFNTLSWDRTGPVGIELVGWPADWATARDDRGPLPVYDVEHRPDGTTVICTLGRDVPALGTGSIHLSPATRQPGIENLDGEPIENERFRITSDEHGIISMVDKLNGEELIDPAVPRR